MGLSDDIALVILAEKVNGTKPAKVFTGGNETGALIHIAGMGDMGNGKTGPQKWDKITRGATNRVDSADAKWIYFDFDEPGAADVTELEGISGPGDSGGPAFMIINGEKYVCGISSHQKGADRAGRGRYGVTECYSRVSSYAEWIAMHMKSFE